MKHKIFTVFDSKAKAYLTPFFLHEEGMAIRVFSDCINDATHMFGKHPEDYTLFMQGSWSDDKAEFLTKSPIAISNGIELLNPEKLADQYKLFSDEEREDEDEKAERFHNDPEIGDLKEVK